MVFPLVAESSEEMLARMRAVEVELVEAGVEASLTEDQVTLLLEDRGELEEAEAEDLRSQLSKPTLLFVFRNVSGDINKGSYYLCMMNNEYEDRYDWNIFRPVPPG